jgi:type VI secretion system secreted protein VgrG
MKVVIEAGAQISLKVGGNFIDINPAGIFIKGTMVMINSGGSAGSGSGSSPDKAEAPKVAPNAKPGKVAKAEAKKIKKNPASLSSTTVSAFSNPQAQALSSAAEDGTPFCEVCNS